MTLSLRLTEPQRERYVGMCLSPHGFGMVQPSLFGKRQKSGDRPGGIDGREKRFGGIIGQTCHASGGLQRLAQQNSALHIGRKLRRNRMANRSLPVECAHIKVKQGSKIIQRSVFRDTLPLAGLRGLQIGLEPPAFLFTRRSPGIGGQQARRRQRRAPLLGCLLRRLEPRQRGPAVHNGLFERRFSPGMATFERTGQMRQKTQDLICLGKRCSKLRQKRRKAFSPGGGYGDLSTSQKATAGHGRAAACRYGFEGRRQATGLSVETQGKAHQIRLDTGASGQKIGDADPA